MNKLVFSVLAVATVGAVAAQSQPVFSQPYNANGGGLSGYESRFVVGPPGFGWRAYDDFVATSLTLVNTIVWYGRVANPKQLWPTQWWRISVHFDINCSVGSQAGGYRVRATNRRVGVDCQGFPVYRFQARAAFLLQGPFWLSVAEEDATSATPGKPDFFWSGYQPLRGCAARQTNRLNWRSLFDACNRGQTDLAFELFSD